MLLTLSPGTTATSFVVSRGDLWVSFESFSFLKDSPVDVKMISLFFFFHFWPQQAGLGQAEPGVLASILVFYLST